MKKKINAFTLMELLIGMIISSLVIAFGYASYEFIYKQFLNYKNVKVQLMQTEQLRTTWTLDMHAAETIAFDENKLSLTGKDSVLEYLFLDSLIIRKYQETKDTFFVAPKNIECMYLFPEEKLYVSKFSFATSLLKSEKQFCVLKNYSAETLMKYAAVAKEK